ncbi:MAG TPA: L-aspartate oxidase [bacterium]
MAHTSDFLVIGSGIAGLSFALRAAEVGTVTILTKKERADSNTNYAQGGIACVMSPDDSFDFHIRDTLEAGVGLCHPDAVRRIVEEGPRRVLELEKWGVAFTRGGTASLDLGREGGHSRNRIVHAEDRTGAAMEQALLERVKHHPDIQVKENRTAVEFITEHHLRRHSGRGQRKLHCWGVYALDGAKHAVEVYLSRATLLASGGSGQVYLHTTNPSIATGDGIAMAYRAGASVANLEFMQFHPTALFHPDGNSFLISEAVRGFGGILRTRGGEPFMRNYHTLADLAPRDVVARAIDAEMKKRGEDCVYLDVTHLDPSALVNRFPGINEKLLSLKLDMTKEPIPVVPAAHYMCGGVLTDLEGRTNIQGLYATGESACTGVHGANRLASNSLLEALVFSAHAFEDASLYVRQKTDVIPAIPTWNDKGTFNQEEWVLISHDLREIQRLMWDYVGIVRSDERLERADRRITLISDEIERFYKKTKITDPLLELRNVTCLALLIIRCALFRKESRGLHYTTDYPNRDDDHWLGDTVIVKDGTRLRKFAASRKV